MIEVVQTGQTGKTSLLFDMHRLRAQVFKEKMGWDVTVTPDKLEVDQFDLPDTVYLLALNSDRHVIGTWRLLPSTGPTMIRDLWPQYLDSLPMPSSPRVWEVSRFAIHSPVKNPDAAQQETQQAIGEMFCALTELCIAAGIEEIYTFYDERIEKMLRRLNCQPHKISKRLPVDGELCQVGAFKTDSAMLQMLRRTTNIADSLIEDIGLPPALQDISLR